PLVLLFFSFSRLPLSSSLFPYTTLFRSLVFTQVLFTPNPLRLLRRAEADALTALSQGLHWAADAMHDNDDNAGRAALANLRRIRDRKSTRLNSSHVSISYAVFCLKKKND